MKNRKKSSEGRERKRILFVEGNEDGTVGGSHRALFELVTRLDRGRFEPVVLFFQNNVFVERLREKGIEVHLFEEERAQEWETRTSGGLVRKVLDILVHAIRRRTRLLLQLNVDLVHLNNSPLRGFPDWLPACRLVRIPIISSVRGDARGTEKPWDRYFYRFFDRLLPVSAWIGDAMREAGVPDRKVEVVLDGVDVAGIRANIIRSPESIRSSLGVPDDALFVVMVGNFQPWKGHQVALDALMQLKESDKIFLALVGDVSPGHREHEIHLRDFVSSRKLDERVKFLGHRSDIAELFSAADVALHASLEREPFGLVVAEAMATGTPVIAADGGGPREILTAETGYIHNPHRPEELAGIFRMLLDDPRQLQEKESAVRSRASQFDVSRTVARMEGVYDALFENRPGLPRRRKSRKRPAASHPDSAERRSA
jgi:glycosyltransferase involved in cell wall biosynthesis